MKIPKIEMLLLFDNAIIAGLLYYIFRPIIAEAALCFVLVFIFGVAIYLMLRKMIRRKQ